MDALSIDRIQFAFTATFHYLFPQLTMGLALLIVVLKTIALRTGDEHFNAAARFWARIFAIASSLKARMVQSPWQPAILRTKLRSKAAPGGVGTPSRRNCVG